MIEVVIIFAPRVQEMILMTDAVRQKAKSEMLVVDESEMGGRHEEGASKIPDGEVNGCQGTSWVLAYEAEAKAQHSDGYRNSGYESASIE